jgi:hypothetical protein
LGTDHDPTLTSSEDNGGEETSPKGDILVRQYGLQNPLDWDKDCQEHLFLMNRFWNQLVEIERDSTRRYFETVGADPTVAEVQTPLIAKLGQRKALVEERNARRAAARSRQINTTDLDDQIEALSKEIRELTVEAKKRRQAARILYKAELDTIEAQRRAQVKEARQNTGLWWSNYNAVARAYNVARVRALKTGGELQFHSYDGSGRFTCQIQGGMSTEELYKGARSEVRMDPVPAEAYWTDSRGARRRMTRSRLTITVYTDKDDQGKPRRRTLTFPIHLHRPIPDDAVIKEVKVVRRRIGSDYRWSATFTCRMPGVLKVTHPSKEACAIDIGWRKRKDGLRVATVVDTQDKIQYVTLPTEFFERMDRIAYLHGVIDDEFNDLQQQLRDRLPPENEIPEELRERLTSLLRSRKAKAHRLSVTKFLWNDKYPDFEPKTLEFFDTARKRLKRLFDEATHLREKAMAFRKDYYWNVAKQLASAYGVIAIEEFNLTKVAKVKTPVGKQPSAPAEVRKMRQYAAVAEFRRCLMLQAAKTGSIVEAHDAAFTSVRCFQCWHINEEVDPYDVLWTCGHCGQVFDQDENAARNLLEKLQTSPAESER